MISNSLYRSNILTGDHNQNVDGPDCNPNETDLITGLDPEWKKQMTFRSIDDEDLQERYLFICVKCKDNNIIGTVNIDLSPFLSQNNDFEPTWFPIFNYQKGLRGDLLVKVKLWFVKDENVAKHISSTEVEFFCQILPPHHQIKHVSKFVEELIEFKRESSEKEDQVLEAMNLAESRCLKLKRKLAKKVIRMKCNAVIGYRQFIEDEGSESKCFVIRGFGTAVVLDKNAQCNDQNMNISQEFQKKDNADVKIAPLSRHLSKTTI